MKCNMRLEKEPSLFSAKEIIIRVEYKYCPNLKHYRHSWPHCSCSWHGPKNRALQVQAGAVEALVRAKMQHKELIILCLEDCSDWSNATMRRVVMQIDHELSRTLHSLIRTKIPQFARADVKLSHLASGNDLTSIQTTETRLADLLDSTLRNRKLAPSSERLLREDLKSAFEDDLDNIFDITNLRNILGQRMRDVQIELKRIKRGLRMNSDHYMSS